MSTFNPTMNFYPKISLTFGPQIFLIMGIECKMNHELANYQTYKSTIQRSILIECTSVKYKILWKYSFEGSDTRKIAYSPYFMCSKTYINLFDSYMYHYRTDKHVFINLIAVLEVSKLYEYTLKI